MIDWDTVTDDEFCEQANIRVNRGQWSPDRLMSNLQCDDRAKLGILRSAIVESWKRNPGNGELSALHSKYDELDGIYGNPLPARAYAINTTFVGKSEIYQDHAPKGYEDDSAH